MKDGDILRHEFMGIVEDTGPSVTHLKKGDRAMIPFVIACGQCFYCIKTLFVACETTNPGRGAIMNKKSSTSGAGLFNMAICTAATLGARLNTCGNPKPMWGP